MALFGKNKSTSQKHSIIEVIKYDGPNDVFIWRFPNEDFNTKTRLIVGPAQEAIFVKGGKVVGWFDSGTHILSTQNYPFLRSLVDLATGGVSPFSCVVYYVNKVVSMGIEWGTDSPISIIEPTYNVPVGVRSHGDLSLRVENGQMLLEKLVGQTQGYSQQEITRFFSNLMATQVRSVITGTIIAHKLPLIGVDAYLADMSKYAMERIQPIFAPYGMAVNHFTIAAIKAPELEALEQKARELQEHRMQTDVDVEEKMKKASAQKFENENLGISEQDKMIGRSMETLASNPGPVVHSAPIMGIPPIAGVTPVQPAAASAAEMARLLANRRPAPDARKNEPSAQESFEARVRQVKFMLDSGAISQEQYQEKINQMLKEI